LARGRAPKSTIFGTRDNNKNHEFVHEGDWAKESNARRRAPKSTIFSTNESTKKHDLEHGFFGTRESTKKHDFVHEGAHQKTRSRARFFARGKAPKSTILCTKENTQNNVRPKYKEFLFLTVTAIRTDSKHVFEIGLNRAVIWTLCCHAGSEVKICNPKK